MKALSADFQLVLNMMVAAASGYLFSSEGQNFNPVRVSATSVREKVRVRCHKNVTEASEYNVALAHKFSIYAADKRALAGTAH